MFFQPQTRKLVIEVERRRDGTAQFKEARTTLLFVYARQECRAITWKVTSAWRANSTDRIGHQWWSITGNETLKDDLPQDEIPLSPIYLPTLTFHGAKFTEAFECGKPAPAERNLYTALLSPGALQLDVQVNGEVIVPLHVELEYKSACF